MFLNDPCQNIILVDADENDEEDDTSEYLEEQGIEILPRESSESNFIEG